MAWEVVMEIGIAMVVTVILGIPRIKGIACPYLIFLVVLGE